MAGCSIIFWPIYLINLCQVSSAFHIKAFNLFQLNYTLSRPSLTMSRYILTEASSDSSFLDSDDELSRSDSDSYQDLGSGPHTPEYPPISSSSPSPSSSDESHISDHDPVSSVSPKEASQNSPPLKRARLAMDKLASDSKKIKD